MNAGITHLHELDLNRRVGALVVSNERLTAEGVDADVREITFDIAPPAFDIEVGQSIAVLAPGSEGDEDARHARLYTIADLPEPRLEGMVRLRICVRRVRYVDAETGERRAGIASSYLCALRAGEALSVAGPFGIPFPTPSDPAADLILIGSGTGIAPFRAFVKKLYAEGSRFAGRVHLFHGARTGLELLYMNDERNDFAQYLDRETFRAIEALRPRSSGTEPVDWGTAIGERGEEIVRMIGDPKTRVYVSGLEGLRPRLDAVFAGLVGSMDAWAKKKADLVAAGRWVELLY